MYSVQEQIFAYFPAGTHPSDGLLMVLAQFGFDSANTDEAG